MKIIQILTLKKDIKCGQWIGPVIYGLGDDGRLYWLKRAYGKGSEWEPEFMKEDEF